MTDPHITGTLPPKAAESAAPLTRGEVALKIITTTQDLQFVRRPLRLDGVISAIAKDGSSATIQTAKGDVTVQLRNNTPVQQGQNVQIDIPAGSPPRQTILRPAPETPAPQQQTPAQTQTQTTSPTPGQTPVTALSQPIPPTQPSPQQPAAQTPAASQPAQTQTGQTQPAQSQTTPTQPAPQTQPALPPSPSTVQSALPTAVRAVLDQAAPPPLQTGSIGITPAVLPENAIVRLTPLSGLPATTDLLPVPAAVQALIEQVKLKPDLLNPAPKPVFASDEFAPLPGTPPAPGNGMATKPPITLPSSPFDARILAIQPEGGFKPLPLNAFTMAPTTPQTIMETTTQTTLGIKTESPKFFADVLAVTKQNFPVLSLTLPGAKETQLFTLQFPATNIPPGTRLEIQPTQILPVPGAVTVQGPAAAPTTPLTGWTWPVFDDITAILGRSMPQAQMAQTLSNVMPSPAHTATMPPAIMFFVAAIQSGDIASWFGDKAISALRRDAARGGDALSRLTSDADSLSRTIDTPAQDWKGVAIPLVWQSEIQKIHLYYKNQGGDEDDEKEGSERSTRFIFDLNLSRLGDVQLDGMMKSRRLDLILRTGTLFSHGMQTAMREKYQNVLELGNLSGDLVFQNRMNQWVRVKVNAKNSGLGSSA